MNDIDKLIKKSLAENQPSENVKHSIKVQVIYDPEIAAARQKKYVDKIYKSAFKNFTKLNEQ